MNKNNNKKIGLRSARMRQLGMRQLGMRQIDPNSLQAVTVTIPSSTPPITTLTLTANKMLDSSKYNSYLRYEHYIKTPDLDDFFILILCRSGDIYFYLDKDITQNQKNIKTIIIDNDDIRLTLIVGGESDESEGTTYYLSKVTIENKNNNDVVNVIKDLNDDNNLDDNNLITRYIEKVETEGENVETKGKDYIKITGYAFCPYIELRFSLS